MNIFPKDVQYLIFDKNEIILLYTYSEYTNKNLFRYYYLEKIIQEKIELNNFLFDIIAKCGNIRLMKWLFGNGCCWSSYTFVCAAFHGNLDNMKWLLENECPWGSITFLDGNLETKKWLRKWLPF